MSWNIARTWSSRSSARPGLLDPIIEVRPTKGQIDDLLGEIRDRIAKDERVLVTTLTKKMAEDLTDYLKDVGIKVRYLHSDIKTLERMAILRDLRLGDVPRARRHQPAAGRAWICRKCRWSRSWTRTRKASCAPNVRLIQTIGRAARNAEGRVIMYADTITDSMDTAIGETERRRAHPGSIQREARHYAADDSQESARRHRSDEGRRAEERIPDRRRRSTKMSKKERQSLIERLEQEMKEAAKSLQFERAAELRDALLELKAELGL